MTHIRQNLAPPILVPTLLTRTENGLLQISLLQGLKRSSDGTLDDDWGIAWTQDPNDCRFHDPSQSITKAVTLQRNGHITTFLGVDYPSTLTSSKLFAVRIFPTIAVRMMRIPHVSSLQYAEYYRIAKLDYIGGRIITHHVQKFKRSR